MKLFYKFQKLTFTIRNTSKPIEEKIGANIYKIPNHPLCILKNKIYQFFKNPNSLKSKIGNPSFIIHEDFHPIVTAKENFYDLLVEKDNDTVSPKNTYYWDEDHVLRTHMTAHDVQLLRNGEKEFISIGDVYRRDSIDSTHYPIFHQMDGVRLFNKAELLTYSGSTADPTQIAVDDLKYILEGLNGHLFGDVKFRWVDAYFPFTEPSYELEIFYNGAWLELLGCGILRDKIIDNSGLDSRKQIAWAFGMGLDRLAMKMFDIKDIRLFWTKDKRFSDQFKDGQITTFKSYSKYPPCYKDITFYIDENFNDNDLCEIIRNIAGDMVENVECVDNFTNKNTNKTSKCFRILFRHMDRTVTNEEINEYQFKIREEIKNTLKLELR
jgi:phenylalanyl-tRNA synthetase alpha chain